jgi:hypothetical protein
MALSDIGSKQLAAPFFFTDRPIDPPKSELAIMPYRNLGIRITRGANLLDESTESCPYLDIRFSYHRVRFCDIGSHEQLDIQACTLALRCDLLSVCKGDGCTKIHWGK